jgi:hypothetical protein
MFSERKAKRGQTRVFVTPVTDVTRSAKNVAAVASPSRHTRGRNRRAYIFAGVKTVCQEGHSFPYSGPPLHSAGPCIRISTPESAEFRSAWLLNRSADRFTEFC